MHPNPFAKIRLYLTHSLRFVCIWVVTVLFAVVNYWSAYALLVAFVTGLVMATFIFLIQVGDGGD